MGFIEDSIENFARKTPPGTSFTIEFPDKTIRKIGKGKEQFGLIIKSPSVYKAAATKGFLGVGEQYMLGNLEFKGDMDKALVTFSSIFFNGMPGSFLFDSLDKLKRVAFPETKDKSLKDVGAHYDISNDFYSLFLDATMTYSCAYFHSPTDSLEKAQLQKYEHICRKLQLKKGETLLDVGCGWGGMLIYAAKNYGVNGHGITLSKNQYSYAKEKIKQLKLDKLITIELKDYRDIKGKFDKFVSIGMFEHVTEKYYGDYFSMIKSCLKEGGIGVLHTIGCNWVTGHPIDPWLNTYIFPGTYIPAATELMKYSALYGQYPQDLENLRQHYALTLRQWSKNFETHYSSVSIEKGEKFVRMWRLYLKACRASFVGMTQLWQLTFTNGVNNSYPLTRKHLYL